MTSNNTSPTSLPSIQPSRSTRMLTRHQTQTIRFGDGHGVVMRHGLIPAETRWAVVWQGLTASQASQLEVFLAARHGSAAFLWQPPGASASQHFICGEWQITPTSSEYYNVTAQFQRIHQQAG